MASGSATTDPKISKGIKRQIDSLGRKQANFNDQNLAPETDEVEEFAQPKTRISPSFNADELNGGRTTTSQPGPSMAPGGGNGSEPADTGQSGEGEDEEEEGEEEEGGKEAKKPDLVNQVRHKIEEAAGRIAKKAKSFIIKAILKSPYFWIFAAVILLILVGLGLIAGWRGGSFGPTSKGGGIVTPVSAFADRGWVETLLIAANDLDVKNEKMSDIKVKLGTALTSIKTELEKPENASLSGSPQAIAEINSLNSQVTLLNIQDSGSRQKAAEIKTKLLELLKKLNPCNELIRLGKERKVIIPRNVPDYNAALELEELDQTGLIIRNSRDETGDHSKVPLDPRVCAILVTMAEHVSEIGVPDIPISLFVKNHRRRSSNGTDSDHWTGNAVDIDIRTIEEGGKIARWVINNQDSLRKAGIFPKQMIPPLAHKQWAVSRWKQNPGAYKDSTYRQHDNHLHVGYGKK